MHILHLGIEPTWRGGENQIAFLIKGLQQKGVETSVAYPKKSVAFERFSQIAKTLGLASSSAYDPRNISALLKWVDENKVTHLDAHSSAAHSLALNLKLFRSELKLTVHRRVDNPIRKNFFTKTKYYSSETGAYVAISDCIARILHEYGIPKTKIHTVKSSVDPSPYKDIDGEKEKQKYLSERGLSAETILVGFAGAFTDQKGADVLLKAVHELKEKDLDFYCLIAGDGPLAEEHHKLANQLELKTKVSFLGNLDNVKPFLKAIDILAMPSNYEGLGTLALDGIYAGCAVAATEVGGIPEMIVNDQTGLLSQKGDALGLASNLEKLIRSKDLRNDLNQRAKEKISNEFSLEKMVSGNLAVYQGLKT